MRCVSPGSVSFSPNCIISEIVRIFLSTNNPATSFPTELLHSLINRSFHMTLLRVGAFLQLIFLITFFLLGHPSYTSFAIECLDSPIDDSFLLSPCSLFDCLGFPCRSFCQWLHLTICLLPTVPQVVCRC